jgi:hypothetical protein
MAQLSGELTKLTEPLAKKKASREVAKIAIAMMG